MKRNLLLAVAGALLALVAILLLALAPRARRGPGQLRVLTDRTQSHLAPLLASYEQATGHSVHVVYLDKGLISRLESRPTEADVVITKDADLLELARGKGLLQPFSSKAIEQSVAAQWREPSGAYFTDSYRARVIFYSRARVRPEELSSYEALADPKWKGRVCIRSGYHDYNLSLFGQMMASLGPERTRAFVQGLAANVARTPSGDDRSQVRAIHEGLCDVALANSYYMGIMLSSQEQRPWGESSAVFFPDQTGEGTYVLRSGLALTRATDNVKEATELLEFMVSQPAQEMLAQLTFAYPIDSSIPMTAVNQKLGQRQREVLEGRFKLRLVPLQDTVAQREPLLRMLDELQFDKPR
jgi:iron(III) transport system substrate-binding protein